MENLRAMADLSVWDESCGTRTRMKCLEYNRDVVD